MPIPMPPPQIVAEYMKLMGDKMDEELAETITELDGRFQTVRLRERCASVR